MELKEKIAREEVKRLIKFWQERKEQSQTPAQAQECNRHLFPLYDLAQ